MRISGKELKRLREEYPAGARVALDHMDDVQAPKPGTEGTVRFVDDAGSVHVSWDGGGSLAVLYGIDKAHRIGGRA